MAFQEYNNEHIHNLKKSDFAEICRICLNKKQTENLFYAKFDDITVMKMLQSLDIQLMENDEGPQNICKTCMEHVYHAYLFFNYWKQSSKIINAILLNSVSERVVKTEAIEPELIIKEGESKELENISKQEINVLQCLLCDWEADVEDLKKHYNTSHSIKFNKSNNDFKCLICDINLESAESLENHYNSKDHLNGIKTSINKAKSTKKVKVKKLKGVKRKRKTLKDNSFFCTICSKDFDSFQDIFSHFESDHADSQICIICNKMIRSHLKVHMQTHAQKGRKFFCKTCLTFFENQEKLDEHTLTKDHIKKAQRICIYCDKQFRNARCLNEHVQSHKLAEAGVTLICDICGQSFLRKASMLRHIKVVHEGKRFYCSQCPKNFTSNAKLRMHAAKHHSTGPPPVPVKKFLCNQCPKIFSCQKSFNKHLATHIADHLPCQVTDCTEKFPNKESLYQHLKSAHETLNCLKCNKQYYNNNKFQSHLAFHEWEALPEIVLDPLANQSKACKACGARFEDEDNLLQHVRNVHKVYLCHCKKAFASYLNLSSHMSKIHRSRKEFKCEICGKILYSNLTFKEHMDKHENIQRHTCHICNKSFTYRNYYQIHMRSHTEDETPKMFTD